jgi:hypothetical protein
MRDSSIAGHGVGVEVQAVDEVRGEAALARSRCEKTAFLADPLGRLQTILGGIGVDHQMWKKVLDLDADVADARRTVLDCG